MKAHALFFTFILLARPAHSQVNLSLNITLDNDSAARLSWTNTPGGSLLEWTDALFDTNSWNPFPSLPLLANDSFSLVVSSSAEAHFFRLRSTDPATMPSPEPNAPAIDRAVETPLKVATEFLYTGPNPVQIGVPPGTIDSRRVAVLRGKAKQRNDAPLPGVLVRVKDHPEFGYTLTRGDGMFDLVINGGGQIVVSYEKNGYLPVHRPTTAPWQQYTWLPDVVLIPLDPIVTTVQFGSNEPAQVMTSSIQTDADGTRSAKILVPASTTAELVLPNGSRLPVTSLNLRASEYTVGTNGPSAMPGPLPFAVGYTYCVELSADEAIQSGATSIEFNQAVAFYVENFLGFPVGMFVPTGYYDRQQAVWMPSPDGQVIEILTIVGGVAELDTDGDGQIDNGALLGVTSAERSQLGTLYTAGQKLWRIPMSHLTSWDANKPYGPPHDAVPPPPPPEPKPAPKDPCSKPGSIVELQTQVLGEAMPIQGTPFELVYRSDNVPGNKTLAGVDIPVTLGPTPASLLGIRLTVSVAGQRFMTTFNQVPTNLTYRFTWDGRDGFGRLIEGFQTAIVEVRYLYPIHYLRPNKAGPSSWGAFGQPGLLAGTGRTALGDEGFHSARVWQQLVAVSDARNQRLGGWRLNVHHRYHPASGVLEFGDRLRRTESAAVYRNVPRSVGSLTISDLAVGRDGSVYFGTGSANGSVIWRLKSDGVGERYVGGGVIQNGNGIPATNAQLAVNGPRIAVGPDNSLYFAEPTTNGLSQVRRVRPDGILITVAGGGDPPVGNGDGGLATSARLRAADAVAAGPDGSLYVGDVNFAGSVLVRRVDPGGIITTIAGAEIPDPFNNGDGGPARDATLGFTTITTGPDGSIYLGGGNAIRRIDNSGIINTVVGGENLTTPPDFGIGLPATQVGLGSPFSSSLGPAIGADGAIYFAMPFNAINPWLGIYKVGLDGIRRRVVGNGTLGGEFDGGPANGPLPGLRAFALGPDGLYFASEVQILRLAQGRLAVPNTFDNFIPSEDGAEIYRFNPAGRHLETLDSLTDVAKYQFSYNLAGLLSSVIETDGRTTVIERDGSGNATAIVAASGERTMLSLDANNFLATLTQPGSRTHGFSYSGTGGLLSTYTNPLGLTSHYTYDADGRLIRNENPAGGFTELQRTEDPYGFAITARTAGGETNRFVFRSFDSGATLRENSSPCCDIQSVTTQPNGDQVREDADGSVVLLFAAPDPRLGGLVAVPTNLTVRTPGESPPVQTVTLNRTATLSNPSDPLSLNNLTDTIWVNGATFTRSYVRATRTLTQRSPEGRTITSQLDGLGRVINVSLGPSLAPILISYDSLGRPTNATWGAQAHAYEYDALDQLRRLTDATATALASEHDVAGNTTALALPGVWTNRFAYDALGQPTNIVAANGAVHQFSFSPIGRLATYTPPDGGTFVRSHNPDGALSSVNLPGGRVATRTYDEMQRLKTWNTPEAACSFNYADASPNLATMSRTPVSLGAAQTLEFKGAGPLPTNIVWSGAADGTFLYQYNNDFNVTRRRLTSGTDVHDVLLAYDRDGFPTNVGPFRLTRANAGGAISQIADNALMLTIQHDAMARLTRRSYSVAGQERFRFDLTYDNAGRVTQKAETVSGANHTEAYVYDAGRRLASVTRNGTPTEAYAYDANGNRTSRMVGSPAEIVSYDSNDRPASAAGEAWTFNSDGQLATRGGSTFTHGTRGELLQVGLPGGATITYSYDALGRRVARTSAAGTHQYFYGNRERPLEITHAREAGGTLTAYYYDDLGILFAMERGGTLYYVAADPVGSPRVVFDASGNVVKQIDYGDSYGADPVDSNPAFELPIGYAGGLTDPATRLVRFGWRDYDPRAGVWITRDPALFGGGSLNLFAYAGGNPVSLRDPLGLFSIAFSTYAGIGAGVKVSVTSQGMSVCAEVGLGVGGGVEINPFGALEKSGDSIKAEAALKYGSVSLGGEIKLDDCGNLTSKLTVGVGPFVADTSDGASVSGDEFGKNVLDDILEAPKPGKDAPFGVKPELKVAAESCRGLSF